jgi:Ca2+-binding EF-hand superfamily protein
MDTESEENKSGTPFGPPVEMPSSNAQDFFEEANITQAEKGLARQRFMKFCTKIPPPADGCDDEVGQSYLTLDDFCRFLEYYELASASHYEAYFYAMDRNRDEKLDFQEFLLGCCAANPATMHILNSFTGYERCRYIFDFYDTNRSTTLEFDEFARLTADCLSMDISDPMNDLVKTAAFKRARALGLLEELPTGAQKFTCIQFKRFYEHIQNERLRGTSRLFRFRRSIIKSRNVPHRVTPFPFAVDRQGLRHEQLFDNDESRVHSERREA